MLRQFDIDDTVSHKKEYLTKHDIPKGQIDGFTYPQVQGHEIKKILFAKKNLFRGIIFSVGMYPNPIE